MVEQLNNAGAASIEAAPVCPRCARRDAYEAAQRADRAARIAPAAAQRDADARAAQARPIAATVPTAGAVCGRALSLVAQLIDAGVLDYIEGAQLDDVQRQINGLVADVETIHRGAVGHGATAPRRYPALQLVGGAYNG